MPQEGLFAWFKSSELGETGNGGSKWVSTVGDFTAQPTSGTVQTVTSTGHGASAPVRAVKGGTSSKYTFGKILADKYTICSLTRYTGSNKLRILTGGRTNWLHGHHGNKAGVAHYDGWLGKVENRVTPIDDWVVLCGHSQALFLRGKKVATRSDQIAGNQAVVIHAGPNFREKSDWAVAEVITWDRALSDKEMEDASAYLQKILDDGEIHAFVLLFELMRAISRCWDLALTWHNDRTA